MKIFNKNNKFSNGIEKLSIGSDDEEPGAVGGSSGQDAEGVAFGGAEAAAELLGGHREIAGGDGAGGVFLPEIADGGLVEGQDLDDAADLPGKMPDRRRGCVEMGGGGNLPEAEADGRELEGSAFQEGGGGLEEVAGDFRRGGEVCGGLIFLAEGKMEFGRIVPGGELYRCYGDVPGRYGIVPEHQDQDLLALIFRRENMDFGGLRQFREQDADVGHGGGLQQDAGGDTQQLGAEGGDVRLTVPEGVDPAAVPAPAGRVEVDEAVGVGGDAAEHFWRRLCTVYSDIVPAESNEIVPGAGAELFRAFEIVH